MNHCQKLQRCVLDYSVLTLDLQLRLKITRTGIFHRFAAIITYQSLVSVVEKVGREMVVRGAPLSQGN